MDFPTSSATRTSAGKWQEAVRNQDVIINLAGASIFSRWTEAKQKIILSSRIDTTRHLVEALPDDSKHITFFSTSAVGYYGFHEDEELTESSPAGDDFLANWLATGNRKPCKRKQLKALAWSSPASALSWAKTEAHWVR